MEALHIPPKTGSVHSYFKSKVDTLGWTPE